MRKLREIVLVAVGGVALVFVYGVIPAVASALERFRVVDPTTGRLQKPFGARIWKGRSVSQAVDSDSANG